MDIHFDRICKAYGEKTVLQNFSCIFPAGTITCILGPSGKGKTTLLRLVSGLESADSGIISGVQNKKISAVFQEDRLIENLSAEKNIMLTAKPGFARRDAHILLDELCLEDIALQSTGSLSGGMKRRVAIARALAADFDLLLLDEPFGGLDEATHELTLKAICRHIAGRTAICVTHNETDALRMQARILRL